MRAPSHRPRASPSLATLSSTKSDTQVSRVPSCSPTSLQLNCTLQLFTSSPATTYLHRLMRASNCWTSSSFIENWSKTHLSRLLIRHKSSKEFVSSCPLRRCVDMRLKLCKTCRAVYQWPKVRACASHDPNQAESRARKREGHALAKMM